MVWGAIVAAAGPPVADCVGAAGRPRPTPPAWEFWLLKVSGIGRECELASESGLADELAMVGGSGMVSVSVLELKWE